MTIQSIIINKIQSGKAISLKEAKSQLKALGYETPYGVDETINTYRFRQMDPRLFKSNSYITKPFIVNKRLLGHLVVGNLKLTTHILYNAARNRRKRTE